MLGGAYWSRKVCFDSGVLGRYLHYSPVLCVRDGSKDSFVSRQLDLSRESMMVVKCDFKDLGMSRDYSLNLTATSNPETVNSLIHGRFVRSLMGTILIC